MKKELDRKEMTERERLMASMDLSREDLIRNWWFYHKWHVVIGIILVISLINIICNALGIGQVKPDFTLAYVGSVQLDEETAGAIQEVFESKSPDMNGDGKVVVELRQYIAADTGDSDTLYYAQAAQTQLVADITDCISYFFLMEDPAYVQENTSSLCFLDGSLPADGDLSPDGKVLPFSDCPELADSIQLPSKKDSSEYRTDVSDLYLGHRGFWTDKTTVNRELCDDLWKQLTKGAENS